MHPEFTAPPTLQILPAISNVFPTVRPEGYVVDASPPDQS
jgi:hypothetical protein